MARCGIFFVLFVWGAFRSSSGQVLTPPYFNLAEGRRITASATCGVGVDEPELFCKLVGANSEDTPAHFNVIQGQLCDYCDPNDPQNRHPPEFAIDGSERWWQSPPLSRGMNYNEVNVSIDLGQLFQVAYVVIKMANSPRPGIWVLERSVDNGKTYSAWQYFADSDSDCERYFGDTTIKSITQDDDVICTTRFSKVVPLEGGEIFVSLLNDRPSAKNFFNSSVLQEFTRATNVRLRLLRTKTLLGHLMSVARQDPTVTRRYFYSVKDISIGGRCVCNGHASVCDITDPVDRYQLRCRCQHHTCGVQCEECCPDFIQKKWRPASYTEQFVCEPCNCFGHSKECIYDEEVDKQKSSLDIQGVYEGGGVCQNCRHNTEGINCNKCKKRYYRPYDRKLNDTDVCRPCQCRGHFYTGDCFDGEGQCECKKEYLPPNCDACNDGYYDFPNCKPCDCHKDGTIGGICEVGGGQCPCRENYMSLNCDQCAPSYYNFPTCDYCSCNKQGSLDHVCDVETGQCRCQNNYGGQYCDRCEHGYYNFERNCTFCNCDARGAVEEICDKNTGECLCKEGFSGSRCDNSAAGFWGYPLVQVCGCHEKGSSSTICDASGQCACLRGYAGRSCAQCSPGYYNFPECVPCHCDQAGSIGISCDSEGRCQCKYNFDGVHCDVCREGFYNFPLCEECNCDPAGVLETFAGCGNAPVGELCECKERVTGRICNKCSPLFWNLQQNNPLGCEECYCHIPGTVGALATCDMSSGQCTCKPHVTARRCEQCKDGTFNLMEDNLFGCSNCECNIGGSLNNICDKISGQCQCRYRIHGQRCDQPMQTHYFPTLYQHKYEAEDGRTPQNTPVRFGYNEQVFHGFSWRGYAVYSELQKETLHDVYINKPSLYRLIFYYMNPTNQLLKGKVSISPENPLDDKQEVEVSFPPTSGPELYTVSTANGFPLPFVLNPGVWTLSIENSHQNLFLDYMVLLPSAFYEATILTEAVTTPCHASNSEEHCLHYGYPDVNTFDLIYGSAGYVDYNDTRENVELYEDPKVLADLDSPPMAWLSDNQMEIRFDIRLRRPGHHVILLNYFTPDGAKASSVQVTANTQKERQKGRAVFYDCTFSWPCRQVVSNLQGEVATFNFDTNYVNIIVSMQGETGADAALHSVVLIPLESWHLDFIALKPVCIQKDGDCLLSSFPYPPESTKVEFEDNVEGKSSPVNPPGVDNATTLVYLNKSDSMVDITGKLRSAGRYILVIHYHQPQHPAFKMDALIQNGMFYEGLLPIEHCPSKSGCRAVLTNLDGYNVFDILENFVLTLKLSDGKDIWLDYVMAIPEANYSPKILRDLPRDKTKEFFEKCGKHHFNIEDSERGFCRESAFALTADYNNGALPCQCNYQGSISFECEIFGGQCPCKANVIGRECNLCRTGYFGFPECKPCDCPSTALCDHLTGECICPPRVIGDKCDRCALHTYGFDPIIGCEECRCNEIGVRGGELQCNLNTGQCLCKDNVVGRRCERCAAGYWSFPFCQLCNCDLRGTEADICSQGDATCFCKANTEGPSCDQCARGTYHLEESNPDGCTRCFCFGKADICSSSNLYWNEIPSASGWKAVQMKFTDSGIFPTKLKEEPLEYPDLVLMNLTSYDNSEEDGFAYFSAPKAYLGKRITSNGGLITYTMLTLSRTHDNTLSGEADLIMRGNNVTALYFYDQKLENGRSVNISLQLLERNFRTVSGVPIKREHFMMMLNNLQGIYVRAQYSTSANEARISDFGMEEATTVYQRGSTPAMSVEQCQCPPNYSGSSCEDCAEGFFRAEAGPFGGFCVPCRCNNHADTCNPVTGICTNCRDNTMGDHCEQCIAGYFGEALRGTPYDCLICSCPLPSITNNFAESCRLRSDDDEILCSCRAGYAGPRCEICSPGFYGQPTLIGDHCKPCECSNNIDVTSPYACDDISGLCLSCLNNSYGPHCERCAPGFYGDSVLLKDCQRCTCDECGTRECQHYTGVCECYPNVIGDNCDKCAPDYWGFASCQGCHQCNCAEASESRQCDEQTGQCPCRPGVTGQRCDRCKPGFWKYTQFGCTECACKVGFSVGVGCDPLTGQCSCLPGVIGDNCEGCPERWVLVEGRGCHECDDCVHDLLDSTDELNTLILPVIREYESAAQSFFLHQRLQVINESVDALRTPVNQMNTTVEDLRPVEEALDKLYTEAIAKSSRANLLNGRATSAASDGAGVRKEANDVLQRIKKGHDIIREVIREIEFLVIGLETGRGAQIELAIREAEDIVENMKKINFTAKNDKVRADFEIAEEFLNRIKNLSLPGKENKDMVDASVARLIELQSKINEMQKHISEARDKSEAVRNMNHKSRIYGLANLKKKHGEIKKLGGEAADKIKDAQNYTSLAQKKLEEAEDHYFIMDHQLTSLTAAKNKLNGTVNERTQEHDSATDPAEEAIDHAELLKQRADELDNLLTDTRHATENALKAANVNEDIVEAIDDALQAAQAALNASEQAVNLSSGVSEDAALSVSSSEEKYSISESKIVQVEDDLQPQLNKAQIDVTTLEGMNEFANENLDEINSKLETLDGSRLEISARAIQQKAVDVDQKAEDLDSQVENQHKNLQSYAEEARVLSRNIEAARRDNKLALEQVKNIEEVLPGMQDTTRELLNKKNQIQKRLQDVGDRIERLRRTITKTREKTNKIKVGIDFEQGSVLELKNPDDLSDTATSTELSVFIRTADRSGLPLFLGTPIGGSNQLHRTSTDDFMAIELDEGYVRLTTNLGAGAHSIVNPVFVADNQWHKIHIKRIGKVVQLSVHSEDDNRQEVVETVEKVLPGTYSILNLDPKVSKLYVGGIPSGVDVDRSLLSTYYTGQMEDLWINNRPIGLWNFVSRGPKDFPLNGAKERLVLKDLKSASHILRFDGTGYVSVETKGHDTSPELSIVITFRTFIEDGLLFLLHNGPLEYVTLEMRGGKVMYQHSFQGGPLTLLTDGIYNDDEWHTIEATRVRGDAVMKIDNSDFQQKRSERDGHDFSRIPEVMFFGGYPGEHSIDDITNDDFRGCIKDVRITEVTVDFSTSRESVGTVPGCPLEEVSLVSFIPEIPGHVMLPSPEGSGLQLVFKFRTEHPNGLLFYTETSDRSIYLSLSLAEGALVLRSAPGGEIATGTYTKYNDSEWHIVIATRENNELRLDIDDFEKFSVQLIQESVPFDGPVFFGGLPRYYSISAAAAAADTNFYGCIGDATLNGRIIDFASAPQKDRPGAMLDTCSLSKEITVKSFGPGRVVTEPKYPIDASSHPRTPRPSVPSTDTNESLSSPDDVDRTPLPFFTFPPTDHETSALSTETPIDYCALPVIPATDEDVSAENGLRFGSKRDSRIEYSELPGTLRSDFILSVDFRTHAAEGIIFYASNLNHRDFVTLYINDGKIVFSFSSGSMPAIMRSLQRYNNDQWHKLVAYRTGDFGRLEIDGFIVSNGTTGGQSKHIEHQTPYYFGGLDNNVIELAKDNTEQTLLSFNGCLQGFRMNNKIVGGKRRVVDISECSYKVEPGVFFGEGQLSHAVVRLKFNVGLTFDMILELKPRKNSGVIMSVHGRRDFILLQLRNGNVEVKIDSGKGIVTSQYNLTNTYQICDGEWHTIQVIKNKHVIVLIVDGINAEPASGPLGASSADTHNPLFLGSQPRLNRRRGNAVPDKFVGCIRNVTINSEKINLAYTLFVGEVNAGVCPII